MRSRYPTSSNFAHSFGPGPLSPAIKALIVANVAMFVVGLIVPAVKLRLGLVPANVVEQLAAWQLVTYMFLHDGIFHILFNMLTLWMFGVELERMWGTRYFTKFYAVVGIGAGLTQLLASFVPYAPLEAIYFTRTIGASGAIYGLLLAYALYFPNRPIYMYMVFPIPAKYFVMIMGAISLFSAIDGPTGVAYLTHLGGLVVGYLYLKGGRVNLVAEVKYRYLKWRINRMRRKFDVYSGGRSGAGDRRFH